MTSNYDDYSLKKLEEWINDVVDGDVPPEQIYDTILKSVQESVNYHTKKLERSTNLLNRLSGRKEEKKPQEPFTCSSDDYSTECKKQWQNFWQDYAYSDEEMNAMCDAAASEEERNVCLEYNLRETEYLKQDKVQKWILPVETSYIDGCEDYFITLPDDLLRITDWKEEDSLEWIPNDDGSYSIKKVEKNVEKS